jgi:hypothetical protein
MLSDDRIRALAEALAELMGDTRSLSAEQSKERFMRVAGDKRVHQRATEIQRARRRRAPLVLVWSRD